MILAARSDDLLWAPLAGRPLLAWTVDAFERTPEITEIVLIVAPERVEAARALAAAQGWPPGGTKMRTVVAGGAGVRESLRVGLAALSGSCAFVVVHDGARPLVTPELIATGIAAGMAAARRNGVAVAAEPVKETIKRVRGDLIAGTEPRERLVRAQTPQVFARALLLAALADVARAGAAPGAAPDPPSDHALNPILDFPDAASLALAAGIPVAMYPGSPENLRVATPQDLALAEALLRRIRAPGYP
jgi:2-C-methyl-D-erythritol 4-phosphate cytidylyltransferase